MDFFGMMGKEEREPMGDKILVFDRKCIVIPHAKGRKGKKVVCGLVYADWCGHCSTLIPKWIQMVKNIRKKVQKNQYYEPMLAPIEDSKMDLLREFNEKNTDYLDKKTIQFSGYPTIFKIQNGTISYYDGERETEPMERWYMSDSLRKSVPLRNRSKHKKKRINNRTRNMLTK